MSFDILSAVSVLSVSYVLCVNSVLMFFLPAQSFLEGFTIFQEYHTKTN